MEPMMSFPEALARDPAIDEWLANRQPHLRGIATTWCEILRSQGDNICELMHDGHPTFCVGSIALAYVNVFKSHVNVGFFQGADLDDPQGILEGTGKRMRHVKLMPDEETNYEPLESLVNDAYQNLERLGQ